MPSLAAEGDPAGDKKPDDPIHVIDSPPEDRVPRGSNTVSQSHAQHRPVRVEYTRHGALLDELQAERPFIESSRPVRSVVETKATSELDFNIE
jgi:hypothetical protein